MSCKPHLKLILITAFLGGCAMGGKLLPWNWGSSTANPQASPETAGPGAILQTVEQTAWRWAWLSLILVLFIPQVRQPVVGFLTALFQLPTEALKALLRRIKGTSGGT